jgi:hypothetical protein
MNPGTVKIKISNRSDDKEKKMFEMCEWNNTTYVLRKDFLRKVVLRMRHKE